MTLYTFAKDPIGKSACVNQCAVNWPPLEPSGPLTADPSAKGTLGVITRTNGVSQITYNGKPLYTWINDKKPGDATGEGVQGLWTTAKP
jgi:predicted lipoprotein with Yx(FWY)xxD motif